MGSEGQGYKVAVTAGSHFEDASVIPGKEYRYWVTAMSQATGIESDKSSQVVVYSYQPITPPITPGEFNPNDDVMDAMSYGLIPATQLANAAQQLGDIFNTQPTQRRQQPTKVEKPEPPVKVQRKRKIVFED